MDEHALVTATVQPTAAVVRGIRPDQLAAPTPCTAWTVRNLVNHLLFWGPTLVAAARKEQVHPPAGAEQETDLTTGDWAARLDAHLRDVVRAWREPAAWQGTAHMGGPNEWPASMIGGMVLGEVVVHGWDLARATGQQVSWDAEVLDFLLADAAKSADQARAAGLFGAEVPVPAQAPPLDRLLGLTGRDPGWVSPPASAR